MSKKIGMSLHIGINVLDKAGYPLAEPDEDWPDGWDGPLDGCEADAELICKVAKAQGFKTKTLLSAEATAENVKSEIRKAADSLSDGDMFLLSYSGHGGQVPDLNKDESQDEWDTDGWDETWCLHDRHLIDDEQQVMYADFKPGVRILILSDSCHSGTVNKSAVEQKKPRHKIRAMPSTTAHACYFARKEEYDSIQNNLRKISADDIKANVLLLSACHEDELAAETEVDGKPQGKFTAALLQAWDNGNFQGTYRQLHQAVLNDLRTSYEEAMAAYAAKGDDDEYKPKPQTPGYSLGKAGDESLYDSVAFSI